MAALYKEEVGMTGNRGSKFRNREGENGSRSESFLWATVEMAGLE